VRCAAALEDTRSREEERRPLEDDHKQSSED
jgi:hypothetical protein